MESESSAGKLPAVRHRHHLVFPDLEPLEPPPLFTPPAVDTPPFRRGPMYSAYSELRDWKIRMRKTGLSPSSPIPSPAKKADRFIAFRKENRKPPLTPPLPLRQKLEMKKVGSLSAGERPEKRLFSARRSFSGLTELKEICSTASGFSEKSREGRGESKVVLRKSVSGFHPSALMRSPGWKS
ncbi:hypothetical protein AXF42_Ash017958 [Apostasia shenzhenica]|uniref:Uncharacterized protein n=1 Tax=Apostasia shenzhenica TaxID=1088818 RepID=A0A2I0A4Z7_9ASPA|nr:hypothetical protein AXF42_Ash017958 [Apostasia shenzhenica]